MHQSQQLRQSQDLARIPPTPLGALVQRLGGPQIAARMVGRTRSRIIHACDPGSPSLPVALLRLLAPDPATLSALLHDRAARMSPPVVEVPYRDPGSHTSQIAIILQLHHTDRDAVSAVRSYLATLPTT